MIVCTLPDSTVPLRAAQVVERPDGLVALASAAQIERWVRDFRRDDANSTLTGEVREDFTGLHVGFDGGWYACPKVVEDGSPDLVDGAQVYELAPLPFRRMTLAEAWYVLAMTVRDVERATGLAPRAVGPPARTRDA